MAVVVHAVFCEAALPQAAAEPTEPLAACQIYRIDLAPRAGMGGPGAGLFLSTTPTDDPRLDYHPVQGSPLQGRVGNGAPGSDDDARVRVLVTGPAATRVIDFLVTIDGQPFRAQRRAWIDRLTEPAAPSSDARPTPAEDTATDTTADAAPASVEPRRRRAPTLRSRLVNYLSAVGADVDPREINALINQWPTGPAVTVLSPARSWRRVGEAPLLDALDQNRDGALSPEEVDGASARLGQIDRDENGGVDLGELRRAGRRRRAARPSGRLATVVDSAGRWRSQVDPVGVDANRIASGPADLVCRVRFGKEGAVELLRVDGVETNGVETEAGVAGALAVGGDERVLSIDYGPEQYEISAVEPNTMPDQSADPQPDEPQQVAVGAVVDGRPLLRMLDTDGDNRLTGPEQRGLPRLLAALDRDGDGAVAAEELPAAVRIVVGRGALVHQLLDEPVIAARRIAAPRPRAAAPEWFAPMDANRDGELSRDEFPGAADQFRALDANRDGLITAEEAAAAG